jgi:hypothetical protein
VPHSCVEEIENYEKGIWATICGRIILMSGLANLDLIDATDKRSSRWSSIGLFMMQVSLLVRTDVNEWFHLGQFVTGTAQSD